MTFKKVDYVQCDKCGEVFSRDDYPNPRQKLWSHQSTATPCDQKKKRKELEEFKRTVTSEELEEIKRLKKQASDSSRVLQKMDELTREVRERQTLQVTIINLTPKVLEYSSNLKPIQELETLDLKEDRFSEIHSVKYPCPHNDVNYRTNIPVYTGKVKKLQAIHPISVRDERGKVFYRDNEVLKVDQEGTVNKCFLKALGRTDETAAHTYDKFSDARPEDAVFLDELLKDISDIHPVL